MILFFYLIASILNTPLHGNLNGLTTPIYIDTVYSFANGEFAKGSVYFNRGFDLPINGTVYLGINGGLVNGPINLNGGTIILTQPIILEKFGNFSGSGFISGNDYRSRMIRFTANLFGTIGTVKFKSPIILQGLSTSASIDEGSGTLDLREIGNNSGFEMNGCSVVLKRFLHNTTTPATMWFRSVDAVSSAEFTNLATPILYFDAAPSLATTTSLSVRRIAILSFSKLIIHPNSNIQFEQITMPYGGTRLEIRHSHLDCIPTSTGYIRMIEPFSHHLQGEISIDGKCSIGSSPGNILIFDRYAKLELLPGAQLTIDPRTHFFVE